MNFIDTAEIKVKAGDGGNGGVYFLREKYRPYGGPAGGDGGKGGSIIIQADSSKTTFLDFKYKRYFVAQNGEHGKPKNQHGKNGKDITIKVPVGTIVIDKNTNDILCDLTKHGQSCIVAKGGEGGLGNAHFATSVNQTPRKFTFGKKGEERELVLVLKTIADIGIVGLPNVGKSTLLSVLTNANPKIGDYPFTTLYPELGVLKVDDKSFTIADIPGIIENAHKGAGLGLDFLKHIERSKYLILAIDLSTEDPARDFEILTNELSLYDKSLIQKLKAIVGTKLDVAKKENLELLERISKEKSLDFIPVSSITNENTKYLKDYIANLLNS
ncbi:GTPase ObgE [Hydrogenobaculum acidophilum]